MACLGASRSSAIRYVADAAEMSVGLDRCRLRFRFGCVTPYHPNMEVLMAVRSGGQAPYAPPQTVFTLIQAFRNRALPVPFTKEVYERAGVPATLVTRTSQTFRLLDLVDEAGNPTAEFEALRRAGAQEYPERLGAIVRAAYADAFQFVDPATDTPEKVRDVFRHYEPLGQLTRIVTLFYALCEAGGIIPEGTRKQPPKTPATIPRKKQDASRRPGMEGPSVGKKANVRNDHGGYIPPALMGLLASVPSNGTGWTQQQRDRFVTAFGHVLDFTVPIVGDDVDDEQEAD